MAAKKRNPQRKHIRPEGTYSIDEIKSFTMEGGTRVVTSADGDIRRPVCAGIDVHKEILMAAVCRTDPQTLNAVFYVRKFKSTNSDIHSMAEWLKSYSVQDVCMESTGKYWIPVFNILEQGGLKPVLTHPKYVKQAKGQKTDFRDAVHIASMFRMDLVVASFIPPADIRDLRELCRYRLKLTYMRTSEKNRFQNSMTVSKVRLDCVFPDPFGRSASSIMEYLIMTEPEDVSDEQILRLVDHRVKAPAQDILESIHGYEFIGIQRDKLSIINLHLGQINECIRLIDEKLEYFRRKYSSFISHLTTMVGITEESALYILGGIETDILKALFHGEGDFMPFLYPTSSTKLSYLRFSLPISCRVPHNERTFDRLHRFPFSAQRQAVFFVCSATDSSRFSPSSEMCAVMSSPFLSSRLKCKQVVKILWHIKMHFSADPYYCSLYFL